MACDLRGAGRGGCGLPRVLRRGLGVARGQVDVRGPNGTRPARPRRLALRSAMACGLRGLVGASAACPASACGGAAPTARDQAAGTALAARAAVGHGLRPARHWQGERGLPSFVCGCAASVWLVARWWARPRRHAARRPARPQRLASRFSLAWRLRRP